MSFASIVKWVLPLLVGVGLGFIGIWTLQLGLPWVSLPPRHTFWRQLGITKPEVIAFQPYWLLGKSQPSSLSLVTDVTYFGLTLEANGTLRRFDAPGETEPGWLALSTGNATDALGSVRNRQGQISLLIHQSDSDDIERLLENPVEAGQTLVSEVAPLMREHQFTDLNLDIESFSDATPETRQAFIDFLSTVRRGVTDQNLGTLTLEITPISLVKTQLIDVAAAAPLVDRVILMGYDFHYRGSPFSGPVAPIGGAPQVREYDVETSIQAALASVPADKLVLGIPLYGYEYETLAKNPNAAVIPGTGKTASHKRVEEVIATCTECERQWDDLSQQPYLVYEATDSAAIVQIWYEDAQSLAEKLELAQRYQLRGVAVWALGYEGEGLLDPLAEYQRQGQWWLSPLAKPTSIPDLQ